MGINIKGLELSTQIIIEESLRRGIHVDIIDQKENLIRLEKDQKVEYIQLKSLSTLTT